MQKGAENQEVNNPLILEFIDEINSKIENYEKRLEYANEAKLMFEKANEETNQVLLKFYEELLGRIELYIKYIKEARDAKYIIETKILKTA